MIDENLHSGCDTTFLQTIGESNETYLSIVIGFLFYFILFLKEINLLDTNKLKASTT